MLSILKQKPRVFLWVCLTLNVVSACPMAELTCGFQNEGKTKACNGVHPMSTSQTSGVETLVLCNLQVEALDLDNLFKFFPSVQNLTIVRGEVKRWKKGPGEYNKLKFLRLVNTSLTNIGAEIMTKTFKNLTVLDLRNNSITNLSKCQLRNIPQVYLAGNPWNCSENLDWALNAEMNKNVIDLESLVCSENKYPDKPIVPIAKFLENVHNNCPEHCKCSLPNVVSNYENSSILEPIIEVNCADLDLTELPEHIPKKTKILRLEKNYIEDLQPLRTNPLYRSVMDLYLDYNRITSIDILEGSYWLNHFRVLSLKGNDMSDLPVYAMENAFQKNPNIPNALRLYLGGNPWRCDCVFTPSFQDMLMKYKFHIVDIQEIKCSYVQGDENSMMNIITLSRSSVCRQASEYSIRALDLLNIVLASLIILILGKLAFDYYYFKKTGRLPWIVTKMP